jgi:hypothetical protein
MKLVNNSLRAISSAALVLGLSTLSMQASAQETIAAWSDDFEQRQAFLAEAESNRSSMISEIIERLRPEAEANGFVGWEQELSALLNNTTIRRVLAAQQAADYKSVVGAAMGWTRASSPALTGAGISLLNSGGGIQAVDDSGSTFRPIAPCRIVDTRGATGGALSATSSRPFYIDNSAGAGTIASQGGDCTLTAPEGTVGVAVNLTATQHTQRGFMTLYPADEALPAVGSTINYTPGTNIANTTLVGIAVAAGADFNIYTLQNVHAVVDLLGYFVARDTIRLEAGVNTAGTFDIVTDECPAGYEYVGAEYSWGLGNTNVWMTRVGRTQAANPANPDPNSARCSGNVTTSAQSILCYAVCQR